MSILQKIVMFLLNLSAKEQVPEWIEFNRSDCADAELEAASIHTTYMRLIEEENPYVMYKDANGNWVYPFGDLDWHEYWYKRHSEAAWYTENPMEVKQND